MINSIKIKTLLFQIIIILSLSFALIYGVLKISGLGKNDIDSINYHYCFSTDNLNKIYVDRTLKEYDVIEKSGTVVRFNDKTEKMIISSTAIMDIKIGDITSVGQKIAHIESNIINCSINGRLIEIIQLSKSDDIQLVFDSADNYELVFRFPASSFKEVNQMVALGTYEITSNNTAITTQLYQFCFDELNSDLKLVFRNVSAYSTLFNRSSVSISCLLNESATYLAVPRDCVKNVNKEEQTISISKIYNDSSEINDITLKYVLLTQFSNDDFYYVNYSPDLKGYYVIYQTVG